MTAEEFELPDHDEEAESHVDERWLVSYSDMMTLLFGLFVLLYSMYDRVDVIQDSLQQKFGIEQHQPEKKEGANAQLLNSLKKAQLDLKDKSLILNSKEQDLNQLRQDVQDLTRKLDAAKQSLADQRTRDEAELAATREQLKDATRLFNSRDKENPPEPDEKIADPRSDGLGGRGTGGHGAHPFHVKVSLPDGSVIEEDAHVGKNGLRLSKPPPVAKGQHLSVEITHNDETIHVETRALIDDNGQTSDRLKYLQFDGNDETTLRGWLQDR